MVAMQKPAPPPPAWRLRQYACTPLTVKLPITDWDELGMIKIKKKKKKKKKLC
jgi:hypothetical protein